MSELAADLVKAPQVLHNVRVERRVELSEIPEWVSAQAEVESALANRGRVLVRFSGTEPLLRIMLEGPDHQEVESYAQQLGELAKRLLA